MLDHVYGSLSYGRSSTFFVNFFTECNTFLLVYGSRVSDKIILECSLLGTPALGH